MATSLAACGVRVEVEDVRSTGAVVVGGRYEKHNCAGGWERYLNKDALEEVSS